MFVLIALLWVVLGYAAYRAFREGVDAMVEAWTGIPRTDGSTTPSPVRPGKP